MPTNDTTKAQRGEAKDLFSRPACESPQSGLEGPSLTNTLYNTHGLMSIEDTSEGHVGQQSALKRSSGQSIGSGVIYGKIPKHIADQIISASRKPQSGYSDRLASTDDIRDSRGRNSMFESGSNPSSGVLTAPISSQKPGLNSKELTRAQKEKLLHQSRAQSSFIDFGSSAESHKKEGKQPSKSHMTGDKRKSKNKRKKDGQLKQPQLHANSSPLHTRSRATISGSQLAGDIAQYPRSSANAVGPSSESLFLPQSTMESARERKTDLGHNTNQPKAARARVIQQSSREQEVSTEIPVKHAKEGQATGFKSWKDVKLSVKSPQEADSLAAEKPVVPAEQPKSWQNVNLSPRASTFLEPKVPETHLRKNKSSANWWKRDSKKHVRPETLRRSRSFYEPAIDHTRQADEPKWVFPYSDP